MSIKIRQDPLPDHGARLDAAGLRSVVDGLEEWASDGRSGIIDRFKASAFNRLRLTPRTARYRKQQLKRLGAVLPYVSPYNQVNKFRDLVRVPGVGHRTTGTTIVGRPTGYLTVRAARGLNPHPRYLYEWTVAHPLEQADILARIDRRLAKNADEALNG
jgi:hypothetical protein